MKHETKYLENEYCNFYLQFDIFKSIKYQLIMHSINKALLPLRDNLLKIILLDIFYLQKIYAPFSSSHY